MDGKTLLITGASGKLGKEILRQGIKGRNVLIPSHQELDITDKKSLMDYFKKYSIDEIIHCVAIASVLKCEQDPSNAIETNALGTAHIVEASSANPKTRFVYISTDYVYPCVNGNYKETDEVRPFTVYGWTKLAGEICVKKIKNHCIIRTSFFDPDNIPFDTAFTDSFSSKMPIAKLGSSVTQLLDDAFIGVINVGDERKSLYELYKIHKPQMKPDTIFNSLAQKTRHLTSHCGENWRPNGN